MRNFSERVDLKTRISQTIKQWHRKMTFNGSFRFISSHLDLQWSDAYWIMLFKCTVIEFMLFCFDVSLLISADVSRFFPSNDFNGELDRSLRQKGVQGKYELARLNQSFWVIPFSKTNSSSMLKILLVGESKKLKSIQIRPFLLLAFFYQKILGSLSG